MQWIVTNAAVEINSSFEPVQDQWLLLPSVVGGGRIVVDPSAASFATGSWVTLQAVADDGQEFLGWDGEVRSPLPEILLKMDRNKSVRATFTQKPRLNADWDPFDASSLTLTLQSELSSRYLLESRTDLTGWQPFMALTNHLGILRLQQPVIPAETYRWYRARAQ